MDYYHKYQKYKKKYIDLKEQLGGDGICSILIKDFDEKLVKKPVKGPVKAPVKAPIDHVTVKDDLFIIGRNLDRCYLDVLIMAIANLYWLDSANTKHYFHREDKLDKVIKNGVNISTLPTSIYIKTTNQNCGLNIYKEYPILTVYKQPGFFAGAPNSSTYPFNSCDLTTFDGDTAINTKYVSAIDSRNYMVINYSVPANTQTINTLVNELVGKGPFNFIITNTKIKYAADRFLVVSISGDDGTDFNPPNWLDAVFMTDEIYGYKLSSIILTNPPANNAYKIVIKKPKIDEYYEIEDGKILQKTNSLAGFKGFPVMGFYARHD